MSAAGNVVVVARVRPLNKSEIARGANCCLDFDPNKKNITLNVSDASISSAGANKFNFDRIFDTNST